MPWQPIRRDIHCACGTYPEGENGHGCMECGLKYRVMPALWQTILSHGASRMWWFIGGYVTATAVWVLLHVATGAWG